MWFSPFAYWQSIYHTRGTLLFQTLSLSKADGREHRLSMFSVIGLQCFPLQFNVEGCSPWGCKELDTTEQLTHTLFSRRSRILTEDSIISYRWSFISFAWKMSTLLAFPAKRYTLYLAIKWERKSDNQVPYINFLMRKKKIYSFDQTANCRLREKFENIHSDWLILIVEFRQHSQVGNWAKDDH